MAEKPKAAKPPDLGLVRRFEHLSHSAPTAVQRCIAGLLTLLSYVSARTSDILRSRNLELTRDSLTGENIMKNPKALWVRWFVPRTGLASEDWAGDSMAELRRCGLHGPDYVLAGFHISLDAWSPQKAVYNDIGRAMRALLVTQCGLSVADATRLTPQGFRHLLVTAGVQLRRQGHVDKCGPITLGH